MEEMEAMEGGGEMEGGAPAEQAGGLGGLVDNVGKGLGMIAELVMQTPDAPPGAAEAAQGLMQGFQDLISMMAGGAAPGGPVPMSQEMPANANSGARKPAPGMG